ncbi:MAG TPA: hypothetical protein VNU49_06370 [Opitutaceae bacterium]|jgi:hypothetical protein|nr:hypothetical protein [Opitutaceae bacterium]
MATIEPHAPHAASLVQLLYTKIAKTAKPENPPPRITRIIADRNKLLKNFAGRRCDQKTLRQRFLAQPDGQHGLGPCAAQAAQFFIAAYSREFASIRG